MAESYFRQLAQDLMNIEINTIVKSEMSGTKLPSSRRQALYELAREYDLKLRSLGVREPVDWTFAGMVSFGELRDRAKDAIVKFDQELGGVSPDRQIDLCEQIQILQRIADQSSQIVHIFKSLGIRAGVLKDVPEKGSTPLPSSQASDGTRESGRSGLREALRNDMANTIWNNDISRDDMNTAPDLDLTPEEVNRIRKAWEIGTERIQIQTVVQIDGDVTTRISESFLRDVNKTLLDIHKDGVMTATGFWQGLVKTLGEMAASLVRALTGK